MAAFGTAIAIRSLLCQGRGKSINKERVRVRASRTLAFAGVGIVVSSIAWVSAAPTPSSFLLLLKRLACYIYNSNCS